MDVKKEKQHHKREDLCKTRPAYRQGKKLTAIKSYTVNNESSHLFIYGVPQVNLRSELKSLCSKFGKVLNVHLVADHKTEIFTECFHVQYDRIQSARVAKRLIDDRSFYGSILHVCYAPEYETVVETRQKLFQRCKDVLLRLHQYNPPAGIAGNNQIQQNVYYNKTEIDVYEDDPIIYNLKRRKCNEDTAFVGPSIPSSCNLNSENSSEKDLELVKCSNDLLPSVHIIPTQVLKRKCNTGSDKKKIVFHNKRNVT